MSNKKSSLKYGTLNIDVNGWSEQVVVIHETDGSPEWKHPETRQWIPVPAELVDFIRWG